MWPQGPAKQEHPLLPACPRIGVSFNFEPSLQEPGQTMSKIDPNMSLLYVDFRYRFLRTTTSNGGVSYTHENIQMRRESGGMKKK